MRIATPPPPLSVAPVVGVNEGRNYLELAWPLINGAEGYVVSREIDGQLTEVADQTIGSHLDLDLDIDASVRYAVCAYNGGGLGPATVIDTSLTPGPPLQAVQGLVLADDNGRPRSRPATLRDARGYSIERARGAAASSPPSHRSRPRGSPILVRPGLVLPRTLCQRARCICPLVMAGQLVRRRAAPLRRRHGLQPLHHFQEHAGGAGSEHRQRDRRREDRERLRYEAALTSRRESTPFRLPPLARIRCPRGRSPSPRQHPPGASHYRTP